MVSSAHRFSLAEPRLSSPRQYHRRVIWLAIVHPSLFLVALLGVFLLVWRGELFVTLTQRSNVETLTIAFFILLFAYFAFLTAPGTLGAMRIAWFHVRAAISRDRRRTEATRVETLGKRRRGSRVCFDKAVEIEGAAGQPWEIEIRDEIGSMGRLRFDGVRVEQLDAFRGSNTFMAYVEERICDLTGGDLAIVQWASTRDDEFRAYAASAEAMRKTWPTVTLTEEQRRALEAELGLLSRALRDEAFLPDWEFEGEHKLPIIPEPLGIISLSRSERRVDPLSSMTAALVTVTLVVGLICFFLARPPWIPGR
ncbi:MAG TPA: hypothetical protein VGH28_00335 [Polyangiaceae bacterium]|jgi:hypothetical protein